MEDHHFTLKKEEELMSTAATFPSVYEALFEKVLKGENILELIPVLRKSVPVAASLPNLT